MATGNMFRKPRSMSRPQNPISDPGRGFQFNPLNPVASTAEYIGMRIANPQNPGSPAGMRRRQALASMLGYEPPVLDPQQYPSATPSQQTPVAGGGTQGPLNVFGGGPPTPGGRAYADRLLPEQRYYMQQQNPMSPLTSVYYPPAGPQPNLTTSAQRPAQFNPIGPAVADARANAQFDQRFPGQAQSSFDASRMAAGRTANNAYQSSVVNGYTGQAQIASPFDEQASRARAQERVQRGVLPAERGGSYGRWADGGGLADYAASGGVPWHEREMNARTEARRASEQASDDDLLGSLVMQGRQSPQMGNMLDPNYHGPFAKRQADGTNAYTNREGAFHDAFPGLANPSTRTATLDAMRNGTPEQQQAARAYQVDQQDRLDKRAKTDARAQKFKDDHGGMSARQFGIQSRQDKRETARYRKAIMQGMNPMSPQAQGLFPDQTKKFMADRQATSGGKVANPMGNPFASAPGGGRTPEDQQKGRDFMAKAAAGSKDAAGNTAPPVAFIANAGVTGQEDNIQDLHFGIVSQAQAGMTPSDDDLEALQGYTRALQAGHGTNDYDPFDMTYGLEGDGTLDSEHSAVFSPMYKELRDMKDNTPEARRKWWNSFRSRVEDPAPWYDITKRQAWGGQEYPKPLQNPMGK